MSIVKMKRLRLFCMAAHREELLRQLQHLGCVQVREPTDCMEDPDWSAFIRVDDTALADTRARADALRAALELLNRYAPSKGGLFSPRPEITEGQLFDDQARREALDAAERITGHEARINAIYAEQSKLAAQKASLAPWLELEVDLNTPSTREVSVTFGAFPGSADRQAVERALATATELAQLTWAGHDREFQYVLLLCHRKAEEEALDLLKGFGFTPSSLRGWEGTARANTDRIEARLAELGRELEACRAAISGEVVHREDLKLCMDRMTQDIQREEVKGRLLASQTTIFLEGWVPAESLPRLESLLSRYPTAWEASDPQPEEYPSVPIQLKNNALTRPLNMVTNMYVLPAYDGVDPNPLMAPFFIFFFGLMMADMAYGILMVLGAVFMFRVMRPKGGMRDFAGLLLLCGISTFIMGALTGGFLGDFIPQLAKIINPNTTLTELPALFTPLNDTLAILVGSLALGLIQIITGMIISVVRKVQAGQVADAIWDEVTWWIILAGIALAVLGIGSVGGYPVVLIVGLVMLLYAGTRNAKGFGKITSLIGNMLNFALNLLGCYVHDLRLQCLEFFNRFYKEGGKPFRPLLIQTKYVDIKEEN